MLRSDARSNMIGALVFAATAKIKEVCIYFNHKLIRGNRAVKFSADDLEGFISPNYPLLAKAQLQIEGMWSTDKRSNCLFSATCLLFRVIQPSGLSHCQRVYRCNGIKPLCCPLANVSNDNR